jgi:hypothetical protein
MPVCVFQVRPNGRRKFAKAARCNSHAFQLIGVASVILYLSVEISDPALIIVRAIRDVN